ncbi:MAG: bifunctional 5,10-methylenetetrahydrofolate dehydrogenase/5,10-methenyltetrahydrofolate cyclohydrolase [Mycoplasmatales bacterium]
MLLPAKEIREKKKQIIKKQLEDLNITLKFAIIQVGDNPASNKYINNKIKYAKELGIEVVLKQYSIDVEQLELIKQIKEYNVDCNIAGIIVQLPLPEHLNEQAIVQKIKFTKDIDGFSVQNIGNTYLGNEALTSCTAQGVITLLNHYQIPIAGKNITIAGRSNLVGKILALLLINKGATVTVCNSQTKNIKEYIKHSDIFISAIGKPQYFTADYFNNKNLTVIDIGINFLDGKLVGDIDTKNVEPKVKNITPVPGGIGVLTVTELIGNVVKAYKISQKEKNGNNNG